MHQGILELHPKGYGFLRNPAKNYIAQPADPFVEQRLIQKYKLLVGMEITGPTEPNPRGTGPRLKDVATIDGFTPDKYPRRSFDEMTPIDPHERIKLEFGTEPLTTRVMDLLTPIGKGQRGLIVAPPRTGKTILLQHLAKAVAKNHPEMKIIMLLIDERPEEVTEMRRTIQGEVIASNSDHDSREHARLAELVLERARRLVEAGKDVFVLFDSLTRLARAYNKNQSGGGRTMSGGVDVRALAMPKKLFGTRSPSWGPPSSKPTRAWTMSSSKNSKAPATWSSSSTANFPTAAFTLPSTSANRARARKSACSRRKNSHK
jgi:transcription termination factor Rho